MAPFYGNYLKWNEKKNKRKYVFFFNLVFNLYSISNGILSFSIKRYLITQN